MVAALAAVSVAAGATATRDRRATPAPFDLVFDGRHTPTLVHEGPFTTTAAFCRSGSAVDVSVEPDVETATRVFRCAESPDTFTARVWPLRNEHGGAGSWHIVGGKGALASLRGKGTWTSVRIGGTSDDLEHITFRSTWQGVTDFDTAPPTIAVTRARATKLRRPKRTYLVRLRLSLAGEAAAVSYEVTIADPRNKREVFRVGESSTGAASLAVRLRPTARTKTLAIAVTATDAVGNAAHLSKTLRIR